MDWTPPKNQFWLALATNKIVNNCCIDVVLVSILSKVRDHSSARWLMSRTVKLPNYTDYKRCWFSIVPLIHLCQSGRAAAKITAHSLRKCQSRRRLWEMRLNRNFRVSHLIFFHLQNQSHFICIFCWIFYSILGLIYRLTAKPSTMIKT